MISINDDDSNDKVRATSSKKRHLSKRERKDLKRARTSGGGGNSKLQQQQQQQQQDDSSMTPTARGVAEDDVTSSSSSLMNGNEKIKKRRKTKQKTREVSIHATSAMSRFSSSSFSPSATTIATTTNSNTNININNPSSNNNTTTVLEEYAIVMSDPEPILLSELRCTTRSTLPCATHMLSGRLQGRLLSTLVTITNSTRILEIGTFTGYATQCLVEGANEVLLQCSNQDGNNSNNTNSSNVEKKGIVVTCEIDNEAADIAREYFTKQQQQQQQQQSSLSECSNSNSNGNSNIINSKNTTTIELLRGPAMETLRQLQSDIDNGTSKPFDFVFLDADKRCYIRYYEYLMSNSILKVGGVILADNVLFKGLVIDNYFSSNNDDDDDDTTKCIEVETTNITTKKEIKTSSPPPKQKLNYWKRRHQDIANTVHEFNTYVNADCRSSVVLLPLRDGLSIIRKKK